MVSASSLGGGAGSGRAGAVNVLLTLNRPLAGIALWSVGLGLGVSRECVSPVVDDAGPKGVVGTAEDVAVDDAGPGGLVGAAEDVALWSWSMSSGSASGWGSSGSSWIGGRSQGECGLGRASSEGDSALGGAC